MAERIVQVQSPEERAQWDAFVERAPDGGMTQCFWWADPLRRYGVGARAIGVWRDDAPVGGALLRSIPVPAIRGAVTECLDGPVFTDWRPEWAAQLVAGVVDLAAETASVTVTLKDCRRADVVEGLAVALEAAGRRLSRRPGAREAIVPLEGRDLDDVVRGFHKGTRRAIRTGQRGPARVRRLTTTAELQGAHRAWLATATRKDFSSVRPWSTLEPVLRRSLDADLGAVFGSFVDDRLVAAVYVTFVGSVGTYIYGGYVDGAERHRPNHVLHLEAIRECLNRGCHAYSLGALGRSASAGHDGLEQFKLGFGAQPVTRPDTLVWRRRPVVHGLMRRLRGGRAGRVLEGAVRRRMVTGRADSGRPSPNG